MGFLDGCQYRFEFGECSMQKLVSLESSDQKTLHDLQDSIIHFTTIVNHILCDVSFEFKPFRRHCNLIYHEYEIHCSIPRGIPHERLCKRSVIDIAQRLYEIFFKKNAGYKVELLDTELEIYNLPQGEKRKTPAGNGAVSIRDHDSTSNVLPAPKTRDVFIAWNPEEHSRKKPYKHTDGKELIDKSFVPWRDVTIQDVQGSYERAKLQFPSRPRLEDPLVQKWWDPYILSQRLLRDAYLDEKKVYTVRKQLQLVEQKVPKNEEWKAQAEKYSLTPSDLRLLLRNAFESSTPDHLGLLSIPSDSNSKSLLPASTSSSNTPCVLGVAVAVLQIGAIFEGSHTMYKRAMLIMRLVGYALMEVSEVAGEVIPPQLTDILKTLYRGNDKWQKQSRNLARFWCWAMAKLPTLKGRELAVYLMLVEDGGEKVLRDMFLPTLPVTAGEFVSLLSKEEYAQDLGSESVPSVVEIVKALLGGFVSNVTICRALGCPDSYLDGDGDGCVANLLTGCPFLIKPVNMDSDTTFSYIYSYDYEAEDDSIFGL